jgi:hypothetical protein
MSGSQELAVREKQELVQQMHCHRTAWFPAMLNLRSSTHACADVTLSGRHPRRES